MKNLKKKNEGLLIRIMKGIVKLTKHKLFKNKLYATILIVLGIIAAKVLDGDCTVLIFLSMIALPLFFAKENYIVD